MNAIQALILEHVRGCREAIAESVSRVDALEAYAKRLGKIEVPQPTKRSAVNGWSEAEDALMTESYPMLGPQRMMELLPHRSRAAISARAHQMGLLTSAYTKVDCAQCDARVTLGQVAGCKSPFCSAKRLVAGA